MPVDEIKKSSMFCTGGHIRIKSHRWLRDSLKSFCMSSILREGKAGLLLGYLAVQSLRFKVFRKFLGFWAGGHHVMQGLGFKVQR